MMDQFVLNKHERKRKNNITIFFIVNLEKKNIHSKSEKKETIKPSF